MGYEGNDRRDWRDQRDDRNRDDRGFFDRAGDEVRSWFGDEEAERRRRQDERDYERYRSYNEGRGGYGGFGSASGYGPYTGGTYLEGGRSGHSDPHYGEWRRRQIEALDRDYDDYRREHQQRFDSDFGTWRSGRLSQRESLGRVREHQEIVGSDGTHLGKVDHVRGDRIILTRTDENAGGRHHSIPCSWVASVGEKVELNCTADYARQAWRDEEGRGALFGQEESGSVGQSRDRQNVQP